MNFVNLTPHAISIRDGDVRNGMAVRYYIRIGFIPANGRSKNHISDTLEDGVSVYPAILVDGEWKADLTTIRFPSTFLFLTGPVFLVTGEEVGTGSDGEPLLRNVSIVETLEKVAPHIHRPDFVHGFNGRMEPRPGLKLPRRSYWTIADPCGEGFNISDTPAPWRAPSYVYRRDDGTWAFGVACRYDDGTHYPTCDCPECVEVSR